MWTLLRKPGHERDTRSKARLGKPKWRECVEISLHTILSEIGHARDTRSKARLGYESKIGESVSREISVVHIAGTGTHRSEYNNTLTGLCRNV